MEYSVTETEESGYETRVNGKITNTAEGTIQIGVNQVECLNKVEEPRGKLKIRKIVEDGDLEKDWHFSIELQDRDGKPLDTIGKGQRKKKLLLQGNRSRMERLTLY